MKWGKKINGWKSWCIWKAIKIWIQVDELIMETTIKAQ